jgi:hypothetical protein
MSNMKPLKAIALQVRGLGVKHLPKMDTFGKCDPFITVKFNGMEHKTKVCTILECDGPTPHEK